MRRKFTGASKSNIPLGTAGPGLSHFSHRAKNKTNDDPQEIKSAFSILSSLIKNDFLVLKKSAPFFCGITRDYFL